MKNKEYEEILYNEILVDCKDDYDQNMSWYYYVQDELDFPFEAQIELKKREGGKVLKSVQVIELSDDEDFHRNSNLKVNIELDDYIIETPLGKLTEIEATERTIEIIKVWKYWIKKWRCIKCKAAVLN